MEEEEEEVQKGQKRESREFKGVVSRGEGIVR